MLKLFYYSRKILPILLLIEIHFPRFLTYYEKGLEVLGRG
jgi:hypothetical protein